MRRYRAVIRLVFSLIFIAAGVSHFFLGRIYPDGYAVFGDTALLPGLTEMWSGAVMPNIGWLTIALGCYQILAGILVLMPGQVAREGAIMMLLFLVFITVVGYGFPSDSNFEDFLKNRLITSVMAIMIMSVAADAAPAGPIAMWKRE